MGGKEEREKEENMSGADDRFVRGLKVPLRALWGKARGGGGRLRQATAREEKKRERRTEDAREEARKDAREEAREQDKSREDKSREGKRRERRREEAREEKI